MTGCGAADAIGALRAEGALTGLDLPTGAIAVALQGHASTRRYFRTSAERGGTRILAVYPVDGVEALERYLRAAGWLGEAGVRVPRVLQRGERALLLEDAGDRLLSTMPAGPERDRLYRQAVRLLARIQRHGRIAPAVNPDWALDAERLRRELDFTEEHALRGWLGDRTASGARERGFDRLAEQVAALPRVTCHRDYHARNLMVQGDRLVVIDFQDIMAGPIHYDAASLLWDNYCDLDAATAGRMLRTLQAQAPGARVALTPAARIPGIPTGLPAEHRQAFCLVAAQRHLKALGTFGYQVTRAGNASFAAFAGRTWGHARAALRSLGWDDLVVALAPLDRLSERP